MHLTVRFAAAGRTTSMNFVATILMGPGTYYSMNLQAKNIEEAAKVALRSCLDANPFWRPVRISEVSKAADDAPLTVNVDHE